VLTFNWGQYTNWLYLGDETEYFTFSEINYVVEQAARDVAYVNKTHIDLNDLMKIVTRHTPELNEVKIQSYTA